MWNLSSQDSQEQGKGFVSFVDRVPGLLVVQNLNAPLTQVHGWFVVEILVTGIRRSRN